MYYKLFVSNLSNRIFNVARREAFDRGNILRIADNFGNTHLLWLACQKNHEIADVVETLETDKNAKIISVESTSGKDIDFRILGANKKPFFNRYTLSLI